MLIAKNSIIIDKPVNEVWNYLTKPNEPQTWIDTEDGGNIVSKWELNSSVTWKGGDGDDYYRGSVVELEEENVLSFNLRSAFEEDNDDPEFSEGINTETWKFTLSSKGEDTELTLEIGDYDSEHDTDEEHEHEEVEKICQDVSKIIIPERLSAIKSLVE